MLVLLSIVCGAGLTVFAVGLGIHFAHKRSQRQYLRREYQQTARRIEARYEAAALLAVQHYFGRHPRGR